MASLESIAIRKSEAQERIVKAVKKLGAEIDLSPAHKEPAIAQAMQLEAIADALEGLAGVGNSPAKATDADAALAQGEATALAEKLEAAAAKPSPFQPQGAGAKK